MGSVFPGHPQHCYRFPGLGYCFDFASPVISDTKPQCSAPSFIWVHKRLREEWKSLNRVLANFAPLYLLACTQCTQFTYGASDPLSHTLLHHVLVSCRFHFILGHACVCMCRHVYCVHMCAYVFTFMCLCVYLYPRMLYAYVFACGCVCPCACALGVWEKVLVNWKGRLHLEGPRFKS